MKILLLEAERTERQRGEQADRQTDRRGEANSRVRTFVKAPESLKSGRKVSVTPVTVLKVHSMQADIKRVDKQVLSGPIHYLN